jgi:hypothetical protein
VTNTCTICRRTHLQGLSAGPGYRTLLENVKVNSSKCKIRRKSIKLSRLISISNCDIEGSAMALSKTSSIESYTTVVLVVIGIKEG